MVSVLAFYSDHSSLNPAKIYICKLLKKHKNEAGIVIFEENDSMGVATDWSLSILQH